MCELITVDFAEKRIAAVGGLEIIHAIKEWHERIAIATDPEEDEEARLTAAGALLDDYEGITLDDIEVRLAEANPPSDNMITIEGTVPIAVADEFKTIAAGRSSDVRRGLTHFEATVPLQTAVKMLSVAQAAGVQLRSDDPYIQDRLKESALNVLPTLAPLCESEAPDSNVVDFFSGETKPKYSVDVLSESVVGGMVLFEACIPVTAYEMLMDHLQTL